jgi:hypothetical protein
MSTGVAFAADPATKERVAALIARLAARPRAA